MVGPTGGVRGCWVFCRFQCLRCKGWGSFVDFKFLRAELKSKICFYLQNISDLLGYYSRELKELYNMVQRSIYSQREVKSKMKQIISLQEEKISPPKRDHYIVMKSHHFGKYIC